MNKYLIAIFASYYLIKLTPILNKVTRKGSFTIISKKNTNDIQ